MLKRTITLVGLTLTVGALLLALGCGGSNNTALTTGNNEQSRFWGGPSSGSVRIVSTSSPVIVEVSDPEGLWTINVQTCPERLAGPIFLVGGKNFTYGAKSVQVQLPKFGEALYHTISVVNIKLKSGVWKVNPDGSIVRLR